MLTNGNSSCWTAAGIDNQRLAVVLPVCDRDVYALTQNLKWMLELDGKIDTAAVVHQDSGTNPNLAEEAHSLACRLFTSTVRNIYQTAPMPRWPNAPNWAFQHAAIKMQELDMPWFWMEPDCVPLRRSWYEIWSHEYFSCGKPIMGHIVSGRGHLNGTAVYPPNFPDLSPAAMDCEDVAWDWVMKDETIHLCHHTSLLGHVWGIVGGKPTPYDGQAATFNTQAEVDAIVPRGAILFHRAKYCDLIDRLRERLHANGHPDSLIPS